MARTVADDALAQRIRAMHSTDTTYGAPPTTAELNDGVGNAERVNHKRVARVMRSTGIAGYRRRRQVKTTVAHPANQKVPDLLSRDFTAAVVNTTHVRDITYLPLATGGNLYLATVIDCCSRRVAGWAIADHMRRYTSTEFAITCRTLGVTQSMGAVGTSADNALAESFNAALKREILQDDSCWDDAATCRRTVFRWLVRTTPNDGTPTAATSGPPPRKGHANPLRCSKPHNHKSRVQHPGLRPIVAQHDIGDPTTVGRWCYGYASPTTGSTSMHPTNRTPSRRPKGRCASASTDTLLATSRSCRTISTTRPKPKAPGRRPTT